ncbi:hypothetical protein ACRRTK_005614 [Alexandromys fortis]
MGPYTGMKAGLEPEYFSGMPLPISGTHVPVAVTSQNFSQCFLKSSWKPPEAALTPSCEHLRSLTAQLKIEPALAAVRGFAAVSKFQQLTDSFSDTLLKAHFQLYGSAPWQDSEPRVCQGHTFLEGPQTPGHMYGGFWLPRNHEEKQRVVRSSEEHAYFVAINYFLKCLHEFGNWQLAGFVLAVCQALENSTYPLSDSNPLVVKILQRIEDLCLAFQEPTRQVTTQSVAFLGHVTGCSVCHLDHKLPQE